MRDILIKEINTSKEFLDFVKFPFKLYKDNPNWVPPLIKDELETLDSKRNPVYQNATAHFYLAYKEGEIVGRIAAIINWIEVKEVKKSKVRFGWFDVIDDINVSQLLLDQVVALGEKK